MPATVELQSRGLVPGLTLRASELNQIKRVAWIEVGDFWHAELAQKHFTREGAAEYNYMPRDGEPGTPGAARFWKSYTGRKQRQCGHTLPLVFSGELRSLTLSMHRTEATATSDHSECRVYLPGSRKANFRPPGSNIDMADELTRLSKDDLEQCAEEYDIELDLRLNESTPNISVAGFFH